MRTATHTYVRALDGPWLLYNNVADPYQLHNLAGQYPTVPLQARLDALLREKLKAQRDDFRPGPEYIRQWRYTVDTNETVSYKP